MRIDSTLEMKSSYVDFIVLLCPNSEKQSKPGCFRVNRNQNNLFGLGYVSGVCFVVLRS